MIYTTSYKSQGFDELITSLVKTVNPKRVVEFGIQQGHSTVAIAKGLDRGVLYAYDTFESNYSEKPFGKTHADLLTALKNVKPYGDKVRIFVKDAIDVSHVFTDILHIDICNHYDNILPLLNGWYDRVRKMILLEGGDYNHWQKKYGFKSYWPILEEDFITDNFNKCIIRGNKDYALTILTKK